MVHIRKSIAAQILAGIAAFILMFLGAESAIADDYIPGLLRVIVNTKFKSDKCKEANKCIDKLLKSYKPIEILQCPEKGSQNKGRQKKHPCGSKSKHPYRDIRVTNNDKMWIQKLKTSPLVRKVKQRKRAKDRLPTATDEQSNQTIVDDLCAKIDPPYFDLVLKGSDSAFESLEQFLKTTYQEKCGDCVQSDEHFPLSRDFSIVYINKEVLKEEDFVETYGKMELTTIVDGQYAPGQWKGKKVVPPTEFQEMKCQYNEQLTAYSNEIQAKLN